MQTAPLCVARSRVFGTAARHYVPRRYGCSRAPQLARLPKVMSRRRLRFTDQSDKEPFQLKDRMPKADGSHSSGTKLAQIRTRRATMPTKRRPSNRFEKSTETSNRFRILFANCPR